jgi:hypothetical protein
MHTWRPARIGAYAAVSGDVGTRSALNTSGSTTIARAGSWPSRVDGFEEGQALFICQVLDHHLFERRERPPTPEQFLDTGSSRLSGSPDWAGSVATAPV